MRYLILLCLTASAYAQTRDTLRVCTYNVMNINGNSGEVRFEAIFNVMNEIRPAVLVVQEIDAGGVDYLEAMFQTFPGLNLAPYNTEANPDVAMFYDPAKVQVLGNTIHLTPGRPVSEWTFIPQSTPTDTTHIFVCHLTANDTDEDSLARIQEAQVIRTAADQLPRSHHHIVAGCLNVYNSFEEAYEVLTRVGIVAAGEVLDPLQRGGDWHNNAASADIHTQSTRVRQFGGGATGGLDDRFDFVLFSSTLYNHWIEGSYTTYGNDGQHFNDSINAMPNLAVDSVIAQALHDASDHLPVYLDLVFTKEASGVEEEKVWRKEMDLSQNKGW